MKPPRLTLDSVIDDINAKDYQKGSTFKLSLITINKDGDCSSGVKEFSDKDEFIGELFERCELYDWRIDDAQYFSHAWVSKVVNHNFVYAGKYVVSLMKFER